jgi:hypothetical protein
MTLTRLSAEREKEIRESVTRIEAHKWHTGYGAAALFDVLAEIDALRAERDEVRAALREVLEHRCLPPYDCVSKEDGMTCTVLFRAYALLAETKQP